MSVDKVLGLADSASRKTVAGAETLLGLCEANARADFDIDGRVELCALIFSEAGVHTIAPVDATKSEYIALVRAVAAKRDAFAVAIVTEAYVVSGRPGEPRPSGSFRDVPGRTEAVTIFLEHCAVDLASKAEISRAVPHDESSAGTLGPWQRAPPKNPRKRTNAALFSCFLPGSGGS